MYNNETIKPHWNKSAIQCFLVKLSYIWIIADLRMIVFDIQRICWEVHSNAPLGNNGLFY